MGKIDISKTETVNASANRIWEILSDDFVSVSGWASTVDSSAPRTATGPDPDGTAVAGRVCDVPGFGRTDERITRHDSDKRILAYSVDAKKIPGFVKHMQVTWSVVPVGDSRSELSNRLSADATGIMGAIMGPIMKRKFGSTAARTLSDLKTFAETGEVSDAKVKANAKLS